MVLNIYNCEAQNYLIHFILRQSKPIIEKVINEKSKNTNIKEEDKDFLCLFYSGGRLKDKPKISKSVKKPYNTRNF